MTNHNDNTGRVAAEPDNDPTAELEALQDTPADPSAAAPPRETDEHTCSFADTDDVDEIPAARLRHDLKTRNESIGKLQYDIEQLRARWSGLEKEIKAREQLTDRLNDELRSLQTRQHEQQVHIADLQDELSIKSARLDETEARLQTARDEAGSGAARISELEIQQSSDAATIRNLDEEVQRLRDQLARHRLPDAARHRQPGNNDHAARAAVTPAQPPANAAPAEPPPPLRNAGMRELQAQIQRTERYADDLRRQLQDARRDATQQSVRETQLQKSLDNALSQIRDLQAQLDDERLTKADIFEQKERVQRRYDDDIGRLSAELAAAQEATAEQSATNEQLAAQLLTRNADFRDLDAELRAAKHGLENTEADMQARLDRQQQELDEMTRKLESKDSAIAALLSELADKHTSEYSLHEIGDVLHELDDRMQTSFDERETGDRERCTRLLVGTIDGQTLRFPLFRDRLTIGRSADNDIQLRAPSISRQHAILLNGAADCRIEDRGSKNGIYVNGTQVKQAILKSGDRLFIGTATLVFEERGKR